MPTSVLIAAMVAKALEPETARWPLIMTVSAQLPIAADPEASPATSLGRRASTAKTSQNRVRFLNIDLIIAGTLDRKPLRPGAR